MPTALEGHKEGLCHGNMNPVVSPSSLPSYAPARKVQGMAEQPRPCLWSQEACILTLTSFFWALVFPSLAHFLSEVWRSHKFPVVKFA